LFLFGPRIEQHLGTKRFSWFYVWCGLGGVLCQVLFVRGGTLVGASAAVFGVMTAYAMQWPNEEIYLFGVLPVRVRTLIVGLFVYNVAVGMTGVGGIAYFAHVGGIIAAWVYMRAPVTGSMDQVRQRVAELPDVDEPPRAIPRALPRSRDRGSEVDDVVAKSKAALAKRPARISAPSAPVAKSDELNRVLDKISQQGLSSLTTDERRVLEEMSRNLRGD